MKAIEKLHEDLLKLCAAQENAVWLRRMALPGPDADSAEDALRRFFGDVNNLALVEHSLRRADLTQTERHVLRNWRTVLSREIEDATALQIRAQLRLLEAQHQARVADVLEHYPPPNGIIGPATLRSLSSQVVGADSESVRHASWTALTKLERHWVEGELCEIIRTRNALARTCGHRGFYDYKVQRDERMSVAELFAMLDALVVRTDAICEAWVRDVAVRHGDSALDGWNFAHLTAGSSIAAIDPFFPPETSLRSWGRTMESIGVHFGGASMRMDLIARPQKYENGFTSVVQPSWMDDRFSPAVLNLSISAPRGPGGAFQATSTLFHESGHAAHFSNIRQPSPSFSYGISGLVAESQAVLFERLIRHPNWMCRFGRSRNGEALPPALAKRFDDEDRSSRVLRVRDFIAVAYVERAIYDLADSELNPAKILEISAEIDKRMTGLRSPTFPLFLVPHLYDSEQAAYFHTYPLAELAADQILAAVSNQLTPGALGCVLADVWMRGNEITFDDFMRQLTGAVLSPEATIRATAGPVDRFILSIDDSGGEARGLGADIVLVDGDHVIGTYHSGDHFDNLANRLRDWLL